MTATLTFVMTGRRLRFVGRLGTACHCSHIFQVALDYNAPMLTLAAMHVANDTSDPYYTSLQAGAYESKQPQGMPCDDVYQDGCSGPQLSQTGQIAMGTLVGSSGVVIFSLVGWWGWLVYRGNYDPFY